MTDTATRDGFKELGIEKVGSLITRGVLIDVAALKGVASLSETYEITAQDLQQAMARQKTTLQPGDAVIIHTGWGKLWGKENARYEKSRPGIGVGAAQWLIKQDPILLGADHGTVEISPNPDTQITLPVHQLALVVHGVHLLENLKLDDLAAKKVYEFAFIMQPMKMQGVEQFGDYAIQIRMKMMTKPGEQFVIRRKALAMIRQTFNANGINFAQPTVQVAGGSEHVASAAAKQVLDLAAPAPNEA